MMASRTLKRGRRGSDVADLQAFLGVSPTDGIFGPMTEAAVIKFQTQAQIAADGVVGPQTFAAIEESKAAATRPPKGPVKKTVEAAKKVVDSAAETAKKVTGQPTQPKKKVVQLPVQTIAAKDYQIWIKTAITGALVAGVGIMFYAARK